jgi:tripeptide aminopeptidase
LLAHIDTSPDAPGANVKPLIHFNYNGERIALPGNPEVVLDPSTQPALLEHIGEDLITSDGTTLLGSDDKAGVSILMQLAEDLLGNRDAPRPEIRLCFTVDEEIDRGVDHLDLNRFGADVAYTLDGSGVDTIYAETFNAVEAVVRFTGVSVHPGYARGRLVNALKLAALFVAELPAERSPESTDGRDGFIHPVRFGESDCAGAEIKLILRDFDEEGIEAHKEIVEEIAASVRKRFPGGVVEVTFREQYRNMRSFILESDRRAVDFVHAAAADMGFPVREEVVRGGTDGARLSELGIPTPNLFDGGRDYHSLFEWNTVQNMDRSLSFLKHLLRYWAENG